MATDYGVDLLIDGEWVPVSTLRSDGVHITNGRAEDAGDADSLEMSATLINQDGALTPRNPLSPNFGKIGQSTQLRVHVPDDRHLWMQTGAAGAYTPDAAAVDITGDIDVRVDVEPSTWRMNLGAMLCGKYSTGGNNRSWAFLVTDDAYPYFRWSTDGTFAGLIEATATERLPVLANTERMTLRFTLDVNNGSGGYTCRFYYATDGVDSSSWTQIGLTLIGSPTTSIFNSTAELRVGRNGIVVGDLPVRVYAVQVRSGIGGTVVANPDFEALTADLAPGGAFVDSAGLTWTVLPEGEVRAIDVRGVGELMKYPTRWTIFEELKTAPVQAYGLIKRLSRPGQKLRSPLYREATAADNLPRLVEYWPGEDGSESTQVGSGVTGGSPMLVAGSPQFASSDRFPGSEDVLVLDATSALTGQVRFHAATGTIAVRMLVDIPADYVPSGTVVLAEVQVASGSIRWWRVELSSGGNIELRGLNAALSTVVAGGLIAYDAIGRRQMFGFQMTQVGANIHWATFARRINDDLTVSEVGIDDTFLNKTMGRATQLRISPFGGLDGVAVGHFMVGTSESLAAGIDTAIVGNDGETAGARAARLAAELGIRVRVVGRSTESTRMGPQPSDTAINLFRSCAQTDGGVLVDARDELALELHLRRSIYNGRERAQIVYDQPGQSPTLLPDEPGDDVVNDYTVTRSKGSSYQAVETTGPLGTDTLGYPLDAADTLGFETDEDLHDAAWWRTHTGTWDEFRYPRVEFMLHKLAAVGNRQLARALMQVMATDRLVITNPPADLPRHPIDQLAQGWDEEIGYVEHTMAFNCTPGRPWQVGRVGENPVESDGSTLTAAIDDGISVFQVDVVGTPWTTTGPFGFVAWIRRAERVTVLEITGGSSPQTWRVARGIDGLAVPHPAGSVLELWEPLRLAR